MIIAAQPSEQMGSLNIWAYEREQMGSPKLSKSHPSAAANSPYDTLLAPSKPIRREKLARLVIANSLFTFLEWVWAQAQQYPQQKKCRLCFLDGYQLYAVMQEASIKVKGPHHEAEAHWVLKNESVQLTRSWQLALSIRKKNPYS